MAHGRLDKMDELDKHLNPRWKIYIDTCSLYITVEDGCDFWDRFVPVLQRNECKFSISTGTYEEIKKHKHKSSRHDLAETARRLDIQMERMNKRNLNLMLMFGEAGEFHDNAIQAKVRSRALTYNQVYITNDLGSAWDVYSSFANSRSVDRNLKQLLIYKIKPNGDLASYDQLQYLSELNQKQLTKYFKLWHAQKFEDASSYLEANTDYRSDSSKKATRKSKRHSTPLTEQTETVAASLNDNAADFVEPAIQSIVNLDFEMPAEGAKLHAVQGQAVASVTLDKKIARGGEGIVFSVKPHKGDERVFLAKVYKKTKLCKSMENASQTMLKINYIVGMRVSQYPGAVSGSKLGDFVKFPQYVLVNDDDEFIGYLMEKAEGIQLSKFIADGAVESEFRRLYPNITKIDLIDICISFLNAVNSLHKQGILVGDLNANNILVDPSSKRVTLIDADSYQYGDKFACNVGVEKYTAPELLKSHETNFRTTQNELFVVARILCEILMMVDNPYNSTIAKDPIEDIVAGQFRYTFSFKGKNGERITNMEAPGEELEIRWGQLTKSLKDSFGNTFHCDGAFWTPGNRIPITQWIKALEFYRSEIEDCIKEGTGVVSNDVFPKEKRQWVVPFACKKCGKHGKLDGNELRQAAQAAGDARRTNISDIAKEYCLDCYCSENGLKKTKCYSCGELTYASSGSKGKIYCRDCWNSQAEDVVCSSCGKVFTRAIPNGRTDKRYCKDCRGKIHIFCGNCGKEIPGAKPDSQHEAQYCHDCWENKSCRSCKQTFPKWMLDGNGHCRKCASGTETYCAKCHKHMGRLQRRTDGKQWICDECWTKKLCSGCRREYAKWMLDENGGYCRHCAEKKKAASTRSITSKRTTATALKPVPTPPPRKKSIFEKLFGL